MTVLLNNELRAEVIGGETERVRFCLFPSEVDLFIDVKAHWVQPISVVPGMEVFLIFDQQHPNQLFLGLNHIAKGATSKKIAIIVVVALEAGIQFLAIKFGFMNMKTSE